jgi:hypothetical protein
MIPRAALDSPADSCSHFVLMRERNMDRGDVDWAGVPFLALHHHDGGLFRQPGLFGLVRRVGDERTLLYVGETENISANHRTQAIWAQALALGMNELDVALHVVERIDRLILRGHIIKRCEPLLNLLQEGQRTPVPAEARRAYAR